MAGAIYLPFKEMARVCELLTWDCDFISDLKEETRVSKEFVEQELKRKRAHPNSLRYTCPLLLLEV